MAELTLIKSIDRPSVCISSWCQVLTLPFLLNFMPLLLRLVKMLPVGIPPFNLALIATFSSVVRLGSWRAFFTAALNVRLLSAFCLCFIGHGIPGMQVVNPHPPSFWLLSLGFACVRLTFCCCCWLLCQRQLCSLGFVSVSCAFSAAAATAAAVGSICCRSF
eukprot:12316082-Karenia_brevis.AAC.1